MNVKQYIGDKIQNRRKEMNVKQDELAEYVGLTRVSICNIESGLHGTTAETIWMICNALHMEPSELYPPIVPAKYKPVMVEKLVVIKKRQKVKVNKLSKH